MVFRAYFFDDVLWHVFEDGTPLIEEALPFTASGSHIFPEGVLAEAHQAVPKEVVHVHALRPTFTVPDLVLIFEMDDKEGAPG